MFRFSRHLPERIKTKWKCGCAEGGSGKRENKWARDDDCEEAGGARPLPNDPVGFKSISLNNNGVLNRDILKQPAGRASVEPRDDLCVIARVLASYLLITRPAQRATK